MVSMSDTRTWEVLPAEEHQYVWDEAERKFWRDYNSEQEVQRSKAEADYQAALTAVKIEVGTLDGKRDELQKSRERLAQELRNVEEELARVVSSCDEKASRLTTLEQNFRHDEQDRLEQREKVMATMVKWFREKRGHPVPEVDDEMDDAAEVASAHDSSAEATPMDGVEFAAGSEKAAPRAIPRTPITPVSVTAPTPNTQRAVDRLVEIIDADGNVIGPVETVEPWNQWVRSILSMPIRRPVKIRRGRKFTPGHVAGIYERAEAKGVKWLSCMIQAIGEIQEKRCISCDKNQGAFDDCIIVGGPLFQKCGNCEWNRQGCHGAVQGTTNGHEEATEATEDADETTRVTVDDEEPSEAYDDLKVRKQQAAREALAKAAGLAQEAIKANPMVFNSTRPEHTRDGHGQAANTGPASGPPPLTASEARTSGFTPANVASRPPSHDYATPTVRSSETSPRPPSDGEEEELPPITRETLVLRHNGKEYTYPEIIEGVPLAKIDQSHPYWDPKWPDVKSLVEPALQKWQERLAKALEAKERGDSSSARFQLGRQVNRGKRILEFLDEGDINPYQLLSKRYTTSGKGSITSYDTLFRLCETLGELAKYGLDVQPVDWMRQRLHELWVEQGAAFNVSKIIHNFYNDPKLSILRSKAGFKNIGRPSGGKVGTGRQSLGAAPNGTPNLPLKKRKSTHQLGGTMEPDRSSMEQTPEVGNAKVNNLYPASPSSLPSNKRPKTLSPAPRSHPDLDDDGEFTDTDSWSNSNTTKSDFRVYQVKSRVYTSSVQVTQYLHWVKSEKIFEHQVLTNLEPVEWGLLKKPIDFEVRLHDVTEVAYSVDALRLYLVMTEDSKQLSHKDGKPRGDLMLAFKRARTLRRFILLLREFAPLVGVREETATELDRKWAEMRSEQLPDNDEEASEELKE